MESCAGTYYTTLSSPTEGMLGMAGMKQKQMLIRQQFTKNKAKVSNT